MASVCLSICGDKHGKAARADTRPLDLLAAHSNRLGGLLAVQTFSSVEPVPCGVCLSVVTNRARQGRAARAAVAGGRARCHFY